MEGCELIDPVGYYIAPRRGLRGGKVTWAQMARWLNIRTLGFQYKQNSLWVLYDVLGMDVLHRIRGFSEDP